MVKIKDTQFCVKNLKMKKDKKILTFRSGNLNPRFSVILPPWFEFSWKVRVMRSHLGKEVKISWLYEPIQVFKSDFVIKSRSHIKPWMLALNGEQQCMDDSLFFQLTHERTMIRSSEGTGYTLYFSFSNMGD